MDKNGIANELKPNYRMNAIVNVARFTSLGCTMVDKNKNQRLKEHQGLNYLWGDVVMEIPRITVPPNHSIYGVNPIRSIMTDPTVTQEMTNAHGASVAKMNVSHSMAMDMSNMNKLLGTYIIKWKRTPYRITPCGMTNTIRQLLQSWNYTEEQIGILVAAHI